jgi:hypothetical protein
LSRDNAPFDIHADQAFLQLHQLNSSRHSHFRVTVGILISLDVRCSIVGPRIPINLPLKCAGHLSTSAAYMRAVTRQMNVILQQPSSIRGASPYMRRIFRPISAPWIIDRFVIDILMSNRYATIILSSYPMSITTDLRVCGAITLVGLVYVDCPVLFFPVQG